MIEKTLAVVVLCICIALLARMLLRQGQRERLDAAAQRGWWWCRDAVQRIARRTRVNRTDAAREAQEAIERASRKRTLH
jgi:hypothetical protein